MFVLLSINPFEKLVKLIAMKTFYSFRGSWFEIFDKLVGIIQPKDCQRFAVWESKKRNEGHLLIVYGTSLSSDWQNRHDIKEITEPDFQSNFKSKMSDHRIHGYNEYDRKRRINN